VVERRRQQVANFQRALLIAVSSADQRADIALVGVDVGG
jgi:hypothetical protein